MFFFKNWRNISSTEKLVYKTAVRKQKLEFEEKQVELSFLSPPQRVAGYSCLIQPKQHTCVQAHSMGGSHGILYLTNTAMGSFIFSTGMFLKSLY